MQPHQKGQVVQTCDGQRLSVLVLVVAVVAAAAAAATVLSPHVCKPIKIDATICKQEPL
jgi:hypothetical protein